MCSFGIPHTLISDNDPLLKGDHIKRFCDNWHVLHLPSSVAHHQKNVLTEAINKNIKTTMKKLEDAKGLQVDELHRIFWALRTTLKSATKEIPFTLIFRRENGIPAEIEVNTLRVSRYDSSDKDERIKAKLDLIYKIRDEAPVKEMVRRR